MNMIPAHLCILIEQFENSRQFHVSAAVQSARDRRARDRCASHRHKAEAYAAMLDEIRAWESRNRMSGHNDDALQGDLQHLDISDTYAAMLERAFRKYEAVAFPACDPGIRTADDATEGRAKGGPGLQGRGLVGSPQLQARARALFDKYQST